MPIVGLSDAERADALDDLADWDYDEARDAITRRFVFKDFSPKHSPS
jgi:4a-hydroxytetrahydrobiopterin dehydratase